VWMGRIATSALLISGVFLRFNTVGMSSSVPCTSDVVPSSDDECLRFDFAGVSTLVRGDDEGGRAAHWLRQHHNYEAVLTWEGHLKGLTCAGNTQRQLQNT
jgi:hypothetical protein